MKYIALRVENGILNENGTAIDYTKWAVRGQRDTDYNWGILFNGDSEEECKEFAFRFWKENTTGYCPVYKPNGYGYTDARLVSR